MASIIRVKRGTAAAWTGADPVLALGEIGFEKDTNRMKVGDGETSWNDLSDYFQAGPLSISTVGLSADASVISANTNNLAVGVNEFINLSNTSGGKLNITGIVAQAENTIKRLFNSGTASLVLIGDSSSSTAANRFTNGASLAPGQIVTIFYNGIRWEVLN